MITENTTVIKVPRKNSILTDEYFKNSPANHKVTMPKILMIVELIEVVDEIVASFTSELKRRETLKDNAYTRATITLYKNNAKYFLLVVINKTTEIAMATNPVVMKVFPDALRIGSLKTVKLIPWKSK